MAIFTEVSQRASTLFAGCCQKSLEQPEGAGCFAFASLSWLPSNLFGSVFPSVLQHDPRMDLGCRSNEFLDHAKT
jgi:hypothetical protein